MLCAWSALLLVAAVSAQTTLTINQVVPTGVTVKVRRPCIAERSARGGAETLTDIVCSLRSSRQGTPGPCCRIHLPTLSSVPLCLPQQLTESFLTAKCSRDSKALVSADSPRALLLLEPPSRLGQQHLLAARRLFSGLAISGSDATSSYTFLRALLIFPQESASGTNTPPFAESSTGFVTSDKPIIVRLSTQVCAPDVTCVARAVSHAA